MDKFLIKRKATGDSSSTPNNNNFDSSKQSRMEINLSDLPADPVCGLGFWITILIFVMKFVERIY